jgi:hypothetical protein
MRKIYSALKRSDNVFDQKDFSRPALGEKAQLTYLEKKALKRVSRRFKQKDVSIKALTEKAQITLLKKIDSRLMDLGLGKYQISQQTLKELNQSLHRIDSCIVRPEFFLKQKFKDSINSEIDFKLKIAPILLERRMFVLESVDELVSNRKIYNLRRLVKRISDIGVKSSIEKSLDDLQKKNSLIKKEYQKLEKLRLNIYSEQQKISSIANESNEKRDNRSKHFQSRKSITNLIMGILLILITVLIAIAPFVNVQVPDILNSTFLIILGFFFGQTIGRLARFQTKVEA